MARNKAKRPGGPPRSPSADEGPKTRSEGAEQARIEAAPPPPGPADDRPGPKESPAADRPAAAVASGPGRIDSPAAAAPSAGAVPPRAAAPQAGAHRPAAASAAASRGWLYGIGGGVIGGAIVALLLHLLPQEAPGVAELRSELGQLRQSVSQLEQPPSEDLLARLEALEAGAAGAQNLPERLAAVEGVGSSLGERIATVEERVGAIDPGEAGAAAERVATLADEVADLAATVAALERAVPSSGAAGDQALADLGSRLDALERRLGQAEATGQQIEDLVGRLHAVEQQIAAAAGLTDDVVSLSGQVGALSTRVDALAEGVEQIQQRIVSTENRRTQAATLALALAQLDAAIEQGQPFEEQLDGLRGLEAADPAVAEAVQGLEPAAQSGVPSLPALRISFEPIASRIVNAARAPEGEGLLEQAAGNLMSLVTVRPVGADVEGDDAAARVARAEAALDRGDLAAAVAELESLQGAAAEAAEPWLADAHRRLAAENALASLQERATSLLREQP